MDLIQKANKLGYKHYTEFTVEELDKLPISNNNKQIEYYFIQKWLREVHSISINIDDYITNGKVKFDYRVKELGSQDFEDNGPYKTYEEALEQGLYQAVKLIK